MSKLIEKFIGLFSIPFGVCVILIGLSYIDSWWGVVGIISGCGNIAGGYLIYKEVK